MRTTIQLEAGRRADGRPVLEAVLVDSLGDGLHRLIASPTLVLGLAAGDVIQEAGAGRFEVKSRGGNLAVCVYGDHSLADEVVPDVWALGGVLDGRAPGATVFTVPVRAGFEKVEQVFNALLDRHPEMEWYYGNVYHPADGTTPLGWWEGSTGADS
jgi:hypothetical protein